MGTRITQDEWDRRAALVGLEWLEVVSGAMALAPARCLTCNHEWSALPASVQQGKGCPKCGANLPVPQNEWDGRAAVVGIEWLEAVRGALTPTPARCLTCGHVWSVRPASTQQGHGCPSCAGGLVPPDEWERRAAAVGIEWLESVISGSIPTPAHCLACGHEWSPRPSDVQQGCGCPRCAPNAPVPQDEWNRRAAAVDIEWLESVKGNRKPTPARCLTCGHEWSPRPLPVQQGHGCPSCAGNAPVPQDEWNRRAVAVGLEWLAPVTRSSIPTPARCLACGHEWSAWPRGVYSGSGCPKCAGVPPDEWNRRAVAVGLEWLEVVRGALTPTPARCLTCGHAWSVIPSSVQQGTGCPKCADYGFDPGAPAIVYLLTYGIGHLMKVGITNTNGVRLGVHASRGWEQVATWSFERGADARDVEWAVLSWWSDCGAWFADRDAVPAGVGFTETVHIGRVDVPDTVAFIAEILKGE